MEASFCKLANQDFFSFVDSIESNSIDLIVTSPPYAQQRKNHYDSIPEYKYPSWSVAWMDKCKRILKKTGSVAMVIRTNQREGRISNYVIKTRIALHESGWMEPEELIWIKSGSAPVGSIIRPRRSWENILWFSRNSSIYCDTRANGSKSSRIGFEGKKGIDEKYINSINKKATHGISRSKDYFEVGTGSSDKSDYNYHPAQYPDGLSSWVIRMLCPLGGTVLDPFLGSGSTCVSAIRNGRNSIGSEIDPGYFQISLKRIEEIRSMYGYSLEIFDKYSEI